MASASYNLKGKAPMAPGQRVGAKEFRPRYFGKYVENNEEEKPKRMHKYGHDDSYEGKHYKKGLECYICKQAGNPYCVHMKSEEPRKASCYNCGQLFYLPMDSIDPALPYDAQLLCPKCKMANAKKYCPNKAKGKEKAEVKDEAQTEVDQMIKKLYDMTFRRNERKLETTTARTITASDHDPNDGAKVASVSPCYTRPGKNIWGPPPAVLLPRAAPKSSGQSNHGLQPQLLSSFDQLFYPAWTPWNGPQFLENHHKAISSNISTDQKIKSPAPQNPSSGFNVNHRMNQRF